MGQLTDGQANLDRRRFVRKAAIAGGTVWAVPTLVSMRPAGAAELSSAPPQPTTSSPPQPTTVQTEPPPTVGRPGGTGGTGSPGPGSSSAEPPPSADSLARTGADIDKLTATGLAAVATGGALTYWSATRMRYLAPATDTATAASPTPGADGNGAPA